MVLNEVTEWYRKQYKILLVFKVDFDKTYDYSRGDFLDIVMADLGFGCKWKRWIEGCLRNAHVFVLVNGAHTDEFDIYWSFHHGDPISPFLFSLAMQGLHAIIWKALFIGLFRGASIGFNGFRSSYLMYTMM